MADRFRGRARPAKKIHTLRWDGLQGRFGAQGAGSVAQNILAAGGDAETILRMRGFFRVWLDGVGAPGREVLISVGLILVPEGQGATVIWDPFNDVNAPWIWFTEVVLGHEELVTDVIGLTEVASATVEIDGKAMRKASPDEELQLVMTNSTLATASAVNANLSGRILLGH